MLPDRVKNILKHLCDAGYEAYAVGGCVRDMARGVVPSDFDITTSALPEETKEVFKDFRVVETGIAHGTVTVISEGEPFEITTFRCDGEYTDRRRPDEVTFTERVEEDLARRDFTINAMAQGLDGEFIDPFCGMADLEKRIVRCCGVAEERFDEDALRIMRAVRFASVLDFEIEESTAEAIHNMKHLVREVSVERVFEELKKLLCGKGVFRVLKGYSDVLCEVIPEMSASVDFDHRSKFHIYDVYTHILKTVEAVEAEPVLRLTMLFHDIGKPCCVTEDEDGRHFKGHPGKSAEIADSVLRRLHADNHTLERVCLLCKYHDMPIEPREKIVRRLFLKMPYDAIKQLCAVRVADASAHNPIYGERGEEALQILALAEKIEEENQCVHLKDLAVNGHDIMSLGVKGRKIGEILNSLLQQVVDETLPNEKETLLNEAKKLSNSLD